MNALTEMLHAFGNADIGSWTGLPDQLRLADVAPAWDVHLPGRERGIAGFPPMVRPWVPVATAVFSGGLRLWLRDDNVLLVEGIEPLDEAGEWMPAPSLGEPDAAYDAVLGSLVIDRGERVYGERGLALRVNPVNGLLLGLLGFVPTDVEAYRTRLRPYVEPARPFPSTMRGGR